MLLQAHKTEQIYAPSWNVGWVEISRNLLHRTHKRLYIMSRGRWYKFFIRKVRLPNKILIKLGLNYIIFYKHFRFQKRTSISFFIHKPVNKLSIDCCTKFIANGFLHVGTFTRKENFSSTWITSGDISFLKLVFKV